MFGHSAVNQPEVDAVYALLIMGVATFVTGLLPTYATAGVWAPILLVLMRMAQGIGLGGEWGGAVLMAVEHAPKNRRGLAGSMPQMGGLAGLLLSTLVFTVITRTMSDEQVLAWGGRRPFGAAGSLGRSLGNGTTGNRPRPGPVLDRTSSG